MPSDLTWMPFDKAVVVNPPVRLTRGRKYPFVPMEALEPSRRDVESLGERPFRGGGSRFEPGDTLLARITPSLENGKTARYMPEEGSPGHGSTEFIVLRGREGVTDSAFVYYLARWEEFRKYAIAQMTGSSGRQRVPVNSLSYFDVPVPPIRDQRAIASKLTALDDKIELNRRMSDTLENIARALFKSWFVDFDPVRAKAGAENHGLPKPIADIFPDSFVDSSIGEIPAGWTVRKVSDVAHLVKGRSYKSSDLASSTTALVTLKSFQRGGGYRTDGLKPYSGEYRPEQVVEAGELIVAQTDVTQAAEVIGRPAIVLGTPTFSTLVASLDVMIVRSADSRVDRSFLYLLFLTSRFRDHILSYTNGTTVLHLAKGGIPSFVFAMPSDNVLSLFDRIMAPLFERLQGIEHEVQALARARDALLTPLVLGDLHVTEPDTITGRIEGAIA